MPEMPEVETVVRSLRRRIIGRRILRAEIFDPKLRTLDAKRLHGRLIGDVFRSGKEIVIDVADGPAPLWLCVHLRMTGRLLHVPGKVARGEKHLRAQLRLDRGNLCFFDSRRFGIVRLADTPAEFAPPGIEILSDDFTVTRLAALLASGGGPLKPWLLRQDRIVGFGNIYASEVCFAAGLDPQRPAKSLQPDEIKRLHRVTRAIFAEAIACGGTTIADFQDCEGECGGYAPQLKVYEREGEKCRRRGCRGVVARLTQAGRSTYYCPRCQA